MKRNTAFGMTRKNRKNTQNIGPFPQYDFKSLGYYLKWLRSRCDIVRFTLAARLGGVN